MILLLIFEVPFALLPNFRMSIFSPVAFPDLLILRPFSVDNLARYYFAKLDFFIFTANYFGCDAILEVVLDFFE